MLIPIFISLTLSILYWKFRRRVPILMYHRIAEIQGDRNALPKEKFEEQLSYLSANGYHTITLDALYSYYIERTPLPEKPVVLTFDDGYKDNLTDALPILKKYNMVATVFPISGWVGRENKWENFNKKPTTTMNWPDLKIWLEAGMKIGGHTVTHPFLTKCSGQLLTNELLNSKQLLEEQLSSSLDFICYPYGNFNAATKIAAEQAGYKMALAIFDHVPLWSQDLYALPRIPIPAKQSIWEFKLKVSSIHLVFVVLRKWERNFKRTLRSK